MAELCTVTVQCERSLEQVCLSVSSICVYVCLGRCCKAMVAQLCPHCGRLTVYKREKVLLGE